MDIEEEKVLKEEIEHLKKELENEAVTKANGESFQSSREGPASLSELISCRERDLELLIRELDDKVCFVKRATDRLGSGAGRVSGFLERSPSQSGFGERPLSQFGFRERPPSQSGFRERLPSQSGFLERPPSQSGFLERPGSRTGRVPGFPVRRPSQSGIYEDSRNMEFMDRPRSRGTAGDVWARPEDGRNTFPGGRERGFLNNRDLDRPHSRERW
ncbi:hypothetical protein GIB67_030946 [Kingdonia uniflora]|uniref:Uncharacterized protein n=1 Tax=Kingdonia uniflora TaxID=39325 RepID=A0A7J7L3N6_9MAGN|nr:hypothetical protein GIB67_030946 [Kingdonia uniflora]